MKCRDNLSLNDISIIIKCLYPITFFISRDLTKCYHKYEDYNGLRIGKLKDTPEIIDKAPNFDINRFESEKFGGRIIKFYNVLDEKFGKDDLINLRNNLSTLKIKDNSRNKLKAMFERDSLASYTPRKNKIVFHHSDPNLSINHELFHASSSFAEGKHIFSGFRQTNVKLFSTDIGRGINEGYTELMTERYFPDDENSNSYIYEKTIARRLEEIVGRDKMEKLYLNSSFSGLVVELSKYAKIDDIMALFVKVDYVTKYLSSANNDKDRQKILNCMKRVNQFLINAYIQRVAYDIVNGKKSYDKLTDYIRDYIITLGLGYTINGKDYITLAIEDVEKILEEHHMHMAVDYTKKFKKD